MGRLGEAVSNLLSSALTTTLEKTMTTAVETAESPEANAITAKIDSYGTRAVSAIGGILGAPLGFLPAFLIAYTEGLGRLYGYEQAKEFKTNRLDWRVIQEIWKRTGRDEGEYKDLWDELDDFGWNSLQKNVAKKLSLVMPSPQDVVLFSAKEAFEPDMIARYGLGDEYDLINHEWFRKIGIEDELEKLYWYSHWKHPEWQIVMTLLHRGLLTKEDVYQWYRLVEIPPYWRNPLTEISWDLPNRIELRMMARYLDLDKPYLVDMLQKIGLHEDYRSDVADMMIAMGIRTDLSTRYRNLWITKEQMKEEIDSKGLSPVIATKLYQWIVKNVTEERVEEYRKLTEAVIISGVKKEIITADEGITLLMRHRNYAIAEAEFVMPVALQQVY